MTKTYSTVLAIALLTAGCSSIKSVLPGEPIDRKKFLESIEGPNVPTVEKELLESARKASDSGNYRDADQYFGQLISKNPDKPEYLYPYAEMLRKAGQCQKASPIFEKLLSKDPKSLDYRESKGLCLLATGDFDKAGQVFSGVISEDSARWKSINGAGVIFALNKKFSEAGEYFDLALEASNQNPSVLANTGLVKAILGNHKEAISLLSRASAGSQQGSAQKRQADLNLALVYGISGDSASAEKAARPHLTEAQLYNNLGEYAKIAKDPQLARTYLNKALTQSQVYYPKAWENLEKVK